MTSNCIFLVLLSAAAALAQPPQPARRPPLFGPAERMAAQPLFNNNCASCHKNVMSSADQNALRENNAPDTDTLARMAPEAIYAALTTGAMVQQASKLSDDEKRVLAEFFGGRPLGAADAGDIKNMTNHCASNLQMRDPAAGVSWLGWGNDLANTRFQPAKTAGCRPDQVSQLKLKWAFGLPNGAETYSQPVIVAGRLFLGDDNSFIYSLDAATGCVYWSFQTEAQVRTSIVIGPVSGHGSTKYAAYFGDRKANVYAVDARNGELLWKQNLEPRVLAHITGSPVLYGGRVYVGVAGSEEVASGDPHYPCCTYRGSLSALDANTGKVIWKSYTIPEEPKPTKKNSLGTQLWAPAGASIWSAPTIDTKLKAIYVSTGNAFTEPAAKTSDGIVAFDLQKGKMLWSYQGYENDASPAGCDGPDKGEQCPEHVGPDWDFANSPILRTLPGGKRDFGGCAQGWNGGRDRSGSQGRIGVEGGSDRRRDGRSGGQIMWGGACGRPECLLFAADGRGRGAEVADGTRAWFTRSSRWLRRVAVVPGVGRSRR